MRIWSDGGGSVSRQRSDSQYRVQLPCGETLVVSRVSCPGRVDIERLSRSEREIVDQVLEGCSNAEIASRRRTSVYTVANQLKAVFRKLGCSGRGELAALLARVGPAVTE